MTVRASQNLIARERYFEDLVAHVARHRKLLELVESGDGEAALKELAAHGERTFQLRPKEDNAAQDVQQGRE
jgi:DNA-binding GntR family transcriptional regulator